MFNTEQSIRRDRNPLQSLEAPQSSLLVPKQPPKRKGLLLIVTLFHASVAGVTAGLGMFSAGCLALAVIKNLVDGQVLNHHHVVSGLVMTLALATLASLLFRAECRNFRPSWHREKKILAALLMTTIPLILWTLRHLAPGRFSSILPSLSMPDCQSVSQPSGSGRSSPEHGSGAISGTVNSGIAVNPSVDGSTP